MSAENPPLLDALETTVGDILNVYQCKLPAECIRAIARAEAAVVADRARQKATEAFEQSANFREEGKAFFVGRLAALQEFAAECDPSTEDGGVEVSADPTSHDYTSVEDDGWIWARCSCGWFQGPFVSDEDAISTYGDHRESVGEAVSE